jgi:hypothetical protein
LMHSLYLLLIFSETAGYGISSIWVYFCHSILMHSLYLLLIFSETAGWEMCESVCVCAHVGTDCSSQDIQQYKTWMLCHRSRQCLILHTLIFLHRLPYIKRGTFRILLLESFINSDDRKEVCHTCTMWV